MTCFKFVFGLTFYYFYSLKNTELMEISLIVLLIFFVGYIAIVLEHPLKLDKTVPALLMGGLAWAALSMGDAVLYGADNNEVTIEYSLLHHLGKVAEILIFLIGAMTIVEIIDMHKGFSVITSKITTKNKRKILIILSILTFFLSAVIDNLTCTIIMISLLRKLIRYKRERIWFIGIIVIIANAGGAWSPIGDVTTTMLWIAGKVSTVALLKYVLIPSIICSVVPIAIAYYMKPFRGDIISVDRPRKDIIIEEYEHKVLSSNVMLTAGLLGILFVPIFKSLTGLPPYMGMMISLAVVWLISEYITPEADCTPERRKLYSNHKALSKIEMSSILFFLGILLCVGALESLGTLAEFATVLETTLPNQKYVISLLGLLSSVFDNVPLVAASIGMYSFPTDDVLWHFIAFAAGTGGSILIIGSASGVAAMGIERIDFIWYLKNISLLALSGFLIGALYFFFIV